MPRTLGPRGCMGPLGPQGGGPILPARPYIRSSILSWVSDPPDSGRLETNFEFNFYENLMAEALCEWGCCQLGSPSHGGTPSSAIGPGPWWSLQKAGVIATDLALPPPRPLPPPKYTPLWKTQNLVYHGEPKFWRRMETLSFEAAWTP